jgi:hypothetical protein
LLFPDKSTLASGLTLWDWLAARKLSALPQIPLGETP